MRTLAKWISLILLTLAIILYMVVYRIEKRQFLGVVLPSNYKFKFSVPYIEHNISFQGRIINLIQFKVKKPKGVVYFLHGGGGHLAMAGQMAIPILSAGYDVIAIDYPGYGKTTVNPNSSSFNVTAQFGYNYVKKLYPENKIIIYGRSLGCAIAAKLASKNNPNKLILGSPVYKRGGLATQLPTALASVFKVIYPSGIQYEFDTYKYMPLIKCSVYIFCGDQAGDCNDSNKLVQVANINKTKIIIIPNTSHSSIISDTLYLRKLSDAMNE